MCKDCDNCVHCWRDDSVGAIECGMMEEMTEEQIEDHIENTKEGCPFLKERYEQDMDYIEALMKHWR